MQYYRFIFMNQKWQTDRKPLASQLAGIVERSKKAQSHLAADVKKQQDETEKELGARLLSKGKDSHLFAGIHYANEALAKTLLLIFPEGTLVSRLTRPKSKAFADKEGSVDRKNMLLPRSTGILFALRTLAAELDDLHLVVSLSQCHLDGLFG